MGIVDTTLEKEVKIVDLKGNEKTWISGVYMPPMWRGDEGSYLFVRCVREEDVNEREIKTITLKESNGSYPCRYWTNLPIFWDTHAIITEAPETIWEYEHNNEVFAHEGILDDWLHEDAYGYWDDGFTEYEKNEFEEKCEQYVESRKKGCKEIPFEEWYAKPVMTREEWLNKE